MRSARARSRPPPPPCGSQPAGAGPGRGLAKAGPGAVHTLTFLMQADPGYEVRIAAAKALGSLGGAARTAAPNIEGVLRQPPYEAPINATEAQLHNQMRDGDYRKARKVARARIQG